MPFWVIPAAPTLAAMTLAGCAVDASSRYRRAILAALACSLVGGYFLALSKAFFLAGVAGFLAANLCYLTALCSDVGLAERRWPFAVMGLIVIVVLAFAWPNISAAHQVPLTLYAASMAAINAQAIVRCLVGRRGGDLLAALGAALLLASDSLIAVHSYVASVPLYGIWMFSTYFLGQWLLAASVEHSRRERTLVV